MDDMSSRLSEILGDPSSMEKLKALAAMFGGTDRQEGAAPAASPQRPPPPQNQQSAPPAPAPSLDPDLMRSMMKLAPALSHMRQDDSSTQLLHALRPFLGERRRKRLDEALRILQLARMLPSLKSSGLLQSLF